MKVLCKVGTCQNTISVLLQYAPIALAIVEKPYEYNTVSSTPRNSASLLSKFKCISETF